MIINSASVFGGGRDEGAKVPDVIKTGASLSLAGNLARF
jgi:hypothetical protein